ncbi:hypothetical protein AAUPMC_19354, partial [Pasteurella multocida subsp. multocida str. Anand1_cattle]
QLQMGDQIDIITQKMPTQVATG